MSHIGNHYFENNLYLVYLPFFLLHVTTCGPLQFYNLFAKCLLLIRLFFWGGGITVDVQGCITCARIMHRRYT